MLGSSMSSPTFSISACATFPERWAWRRLIREDVEDAEGRRTELDREPGGRVLLLLDQALAALKERPDLVLAPLLGLDSYQEALGDDAG